MSTPLPEETLGLPSIETIRHWLQVSATMVDDEELARVSWAEVRGQINACRVPMISPADDPVDVPEPDYDAWPSDLVQALLRRVGRQLAARGIPLGLVGEGEYGPARLPSFDAEIERLEGPLRRFAFG